MTHPERLLSRLDSIAAALHDEPTGLGLLALGSVGHEVHRLDDFSDLDFFAIVEKGSKEDYLADLSWLQKEEELVYVFRNTPDGFKLLYADGVYAEMAIFELDELVNIPYAPGRIIYQREGIDIPVESSIPLPPPLHVNLNYELNELLTNLLVGLLRDHRGEKVAAHFLIQQIAVERYFKIRRSFDQPVRHDVDRYGVHRRLEVHYPDLVDKLPHLLPGIEKNKEAAQTLLQLVRTRWNVSPTLVAAIERELKRG